MAVHYWFGLVFSAEIKLLLDMHIKQICLKWFTIISNRTVDNYLLKSDYHAQKWLSYQLENSDDAFTFNIGLWYEIIIQNVAFASDLTFY